MLHNILLSKTCHVKPALRPSRCPLRAFTLVELLVVIGILGVLTGLVARGLGQVEGASRDAQCKNTHRLTAATALVYVGDKHEYLPASYIGTLNKWCSQKFVRL
jgi:prepilin-type N-terminal cleavage/methylation domain-containing protein